MTGLQRLFAKTKLAGLPLDSSSQESPLREEDAEEEDDFRPLPKSIQDDDSSSASSASSTGTIIPSPSKHLFARPKGFVKFDLQLFCLPEWARRYFEKRI